MLTDEPEHVAMLEEGMVLEKKEHQRNLKIFLNK